MTARKYEAQNSFLDNTLPFFPEATLGGVFQIFYCEFSIVNFWF